MISIKFFRFAPTLEVVRLKKDKRNYNVFRVQLDHEVHNSETQLDFQRARTAVHAWLNNHYGYCVIYMDNQDELDRKHIYKICNRKKFIKDMRGFNVYATIKRAKK